MPIWRIILVVAAVGLVLFCLWAFVDGLRSGPGQGEVGIILHGGLMMVALALAGFFSLVAALFVFWGNARLRRVLLVCVVGPIIALAGFAAVGTVNHYLTEKEYEERRTAEQARRDDIYRQVVPISNGYIRRLSDEGFDPQSIHALRYAFYAEMEQSGIDDWEHSSPRHYFDMVTDLYAMTLGTPDDAPVPDPILGGLLYDDICYSFYLSFHEQFSARQAETFSEYCPDWLIEQDRKNAESKAASE